VHTVSDDEDEPFDDMHVYEVPPVAAASKGKGKGRLQKGPRPAGAGAGSGLGAGRAGRKAAAADAPSAKPATKKSKGKRGGDKEADGTAPKRAKVRQATRPSRRRGFASFHSRGGRGLNSPEGGVWTKAFLRNARIPERRRPAGFARGGHALAGSRRRW